MSPLVSSPNRTEPPPQPARNPDPRRSRARAHATIYLAVALVVAAPMGLRSAELAATTHDRTPEQVPPLLLAASMVEVASPGQADCRVSVEPSEGLPSSAYVLIRGLPRAAALSDGRPWWEKTEGQAGEMRAWIVSVRATAGLTVVMPAGVSGDYDLVVALFDGDGRALGEQLSTLRVTPQVAVVSRDTTASVPQREPNETRVAALSPPATLLPAPVVPTPAEPRSNAADRPAPAAEQLAQAERLLARGEGYLARGDIAIAREYFERAAMLGLPIAALRMAETQDPRELARRGVQGVKPDLAEARRWYQRALELRVPEAESRLQRLGSK